MRQDSTRAADGLENRYVPEVSFGGFGTILAQQAWLQVLRTLQTRPWFEGRLQVSRAGSVFDANGELIDDKIRAQLTEFMRGFGEFVKAVRR